MFQIVAIVSVLVLHSHICEFFLPVWKKVESFIERLTKYLIPVFIRLSVITIFISLPVIPIYRDHMSGTCCAFACSRKWDETLQNGIVFYTASLWPSHFLQFTQVKHKCQLCCARTLCLPSVLTGPSNSHLNCLQSKVTLLRHVHNTVANLCKLFFHSLPQRMDTVLTVREETLVALVSRCETRTQSCLHRSSYLHCVCQTPLGCYKNGSVPAWQDV